MFARIAVVLASTLLAGLLPPHSWSSAQALMNVNVKTADDEVVAANSDTPHRVEWSPPERLAIASRADLKGAINSPFLPELAVDEQGVVHLFYASRDAGRESFGARIVPDIFHRRLTIEGWKDLPSTRGTAAQVVAFEAQPASGGGLWLLWGEELVFGPPYSPPQLYLRRWKSGAWEGQSEVVLDRRAKAYMGYTIHAGDIALLTLGPDDLTVFWSDSREENFLEELRSGEGEYSKTFSRQRVGTSWLPASRLQKRGKFRTSSLSALRGAGGTAYLFWSERTADQGTTGYSAVVYSQRVGRKWSEPQKAAESRNHDGTPGSIGSVKASEVEPGALGVLWSSTRWVDKRTELRSVEFARLENGRLIRNETLSAKGTSARWVQGHGRAAGVLVQEEGSPQLSGDSERPRPNLGKALRFVPYALLTESESRLDGTEGEVLAEGTVAELFDVVVDHANRLHLVYVLVGHAGAVELVYRHGRLAGTP